MDNPLVVQKHSCLIIFQSFVRMDQKFRRRKVGEKLSLVPGKLDHATVAAYSVADRTKTLQSYTGKNQSYSCKN